MKNVQCKRCVNLHNEWCDKKIDSPDIELIRDCQYYRAKTNADSIRAMTDEELAEWLSDMHDSVTCPNNGAIDCNPSCKRCWLDWLKQEI